MAVDALPTIERIARYVTNEHERRPWPDHRISVVPVLTRHTNLMAVVWKQVDISEADNQIANQSNVSRVVFSLTAISQVRKNAARLARYFRQVVPYSGQILGYITADGSWETNTPRSRLEGTAMPSADNNFFPLPERQNVQLVTEEVSFSIVSPFEEPGVRVLSCYNDQMSIDYDPGLDVWKAQATFISTMTNEFEEEANA